MQSKWFDSLRFNQSHSGMSKIRNSENRRKNPPPLLASFTIASGCSWKMEMSWSSRRPVTNSRWLLFHQIDLFSLQIFECFVALFERRPTCFAVFAVMNEAICECDYVISRHCPALYALALTKSDRKKNKQNVNNSFQEAVMSSIVPLGMRCASYEAEGFIGNWRSAYQSSCPRFILTTFDPFAAITQYIEIIGKHARLRHKAINHPCHQPESSLKITAVVGLLIKHQYGHWCTRLVFSFASFFSSFLVKSEIFSVKIFVITVLLAKSFR